MGYTAYVRFTEPVDPRAVWRAVRAIVDAPDSYAWECYAPGGSMGRDGCWFAHPDQGAHMLACMYYGPEGSALDDSEYTNEPEDWAPSQIPPAGYVEVHLAAGYSITDEIIERARRLITVMGVAAAIRDDFDGTWKTVLPELVSN